MRELLSRPNAPANGIGGTRSALAVSLGRSSDGTTTAYASLRHGRFSRRATGPIIDSLFRYARLPMQSMGLQEAAEFLHCHPEELRRRAKAGVIPGAKIGRAWVFLVDDLVDHIRSRYPQSRQALQVTLRKAMECHFAKAAVSGGSTSPLQTASEYAELLGLPTKP
jgi:hypothetical protein